MRTATAFAHLAHDAARHVITGQQLRRAPCALVALRVSPALFLVVGGRRAVVVGDVVEHEALAVFVEEHAALAAHALGDQHPRTVNASGVELDELGVGQHGAVLQRPGPQLVEGRRADRWIGRSAVDLNIVLDHSKHEGSVRLYSTTLRTETESSIDIELSVSRVEKNNTTRIMLFVRDITRRITPDQSVDDHLPRSIEQITERVGRVPLKELVKESTDVIEALCIEAALKLTSGNRASAAELLGLSRQSLYTKLRRFDLGDAEVDSDRRLT